MGKRNGDKADTDRPRDNLADVHRDLHQHDKRQYTDRVMRAVFEIAEMRKGFVLHKINRHTPHIHSPHAQTDHNNEDITGECERSDNTIEAKTRIQNFEVDESGNPAFDRTGREEMIQHPQKRVQQHSVHKCEDNAEILSDMPKSDTDHNGSDQLDICNRRSFFHKSGPFDDRHPFDVAFFKEEVQKDHEQKGSTERKNRRFRRFEDTFVASRLVHGHLQRLDHPHFRHKRYDGERKNETHTEYRDGDTENNKPLLPDRVKRFEHFCIHDRIIE